MRRGVLLAVVASLAVAGCVGDAGDTGDVEPSGAADAAPLEAALTVEGAETVQANASSVTVHWQGTVEGPGAQAPYLDFAGPATATNVTLPADRALRLEATVESASQPVDVSVYNADGILQCRAPLDAENPCLAPVLEPPATPTDWTVAVRATQTVSPEAQFTVELTALAVDRETALEPALPEGGVSEGPPLSFREPVRVGDEETMHEPSIEAEPDGTLWVAGYVAEPKLWRSGDGGESFERVVPTERPYCVDPRSLIGERPGNGTSFPGGPEASHPGCGDVDLAAGGEDTLYFTQHWSGEGVHATHDGGETWVTRNSASNEAALTDRQWLAADGDRAWLVFNSGALLATGLAGVGQMTVSRTLDGGLTWTQTARLDNTCIAGELVHSPADDTLYLSACSEEGPTVATSTDGGLTWDWQLVAERSGEPEYGFCFACAIFPVVDVDRAGNAYVVWADPSDNGTLDLWLAHSSDQGSTWSQPVKVNHAEGTHVFPWVAAGGEGNVVVTWYGTSDGGDPNTAARAWYTHAAATGNALAEDPAFNETLVWEEPVQYGAICTGGTSCTSGRNLGDLFEVALAPDGDPVVAFTDGRPGGRWTEASTVLAARGAIGPGGS